MENPKNPNPGKISTLLEKKIQPTQEAEIYSNSKIKHKAE